jgi:hypothetical protein
MRPEISVPVDLAFEFLLDLSDENLVFFVRHCGVSSVFHLDFHEPCLLVIITVA